MIGNKWVTSQQLLTTIPALYEVLKVPWKVHEPREGGVRQMIADITNDIMVHEKQNGMPHIRKCPESMKDGGVTLVAEIVSHDTDPGEHPAMVRILCMHCKEVLGQGLWMPT